MEKNVQGDIRKLIDYCVDFAESLLNDFGKFYPCGVRISCLGELEPVDYYEGEFPDSQQVVDGLSAVFEKDLKKRGIRGYCIAYDVRVSNADYPTLTDAILIRFRHTDLKGELNHYYPYRLAENYDIEFLEPFALQID